MRERIATSAPPASTVDGQLRRRKDEAIAEGAAEPDALFEDAEDDDFELPEPEYRQPKAKRTYKPGTRQPAKPSATPIGEPPWWSKVKPGEMTKTATEKANEMSNTTQGQRVRPDLNLGR